MGTSSGGLLALSEEREGGARVVVRLEVEDDKSMEKEGEEAEVIEFEDELLIELARREKSTMLARTFMEELEDEEESEETDNIDVSIGADSERGMSGGSCCCWG
jgi:hypothetical protein